jgi:ATP-dependent Clp protease ATP-binding subunit ClpA
MEAFNISLGLEHPRMASVASALREGRRWAPELKQSELGPGLALIGLAYDPKIKECLSNFGFTSSTFQRNVGRLIMQGEAKAPSVIPVTEELQSAINSAVREADRLKSDLIDPSYLLKAVIDLRNPTVEKALEISGIDLVDLLRLIDPNTAAQTRLKLTRVRLNNFIDRVNRNQLDYSSETINEFSEAILLAMRKTRPLQRVR